MDYHHDRVRVIGYKTARYCSTFEKLLKEEFQEQEQSVLNVLGEDMYGALSYDELASVATIIKNAENFARLFPGKTADALKNEVRSDLDADQEIYRRKKPFIAFCLEKHIEKLFTTKP